MNVCLCAMAVWHRRGCVRVTLAAILRISCFVRLPCILHCFGKPWTLILCGRWHVVVCTRRMFDLGVLEVFHTEYPCWVKTQKVEIPPGNPDQHVSFHHANQERKPQRIHISFPVLVCVASWSKHCVVSSSVCTGQNNHTWVKALCSNVRDVSFQRILCSMCPNDEHHVCTDLIPVQCWVFQFPFY